MDKEKLIEKLKAERRLLERPDVETMVWLSGAEVEFILTSLTAPVPDGKEEYLKGWREGYKAALPEEPLQDESDDNITKTPDAG